MPLSVSAPNAGRLSIRTLASMSAGSASSKPKSSAAKVYAVSEPIVTVLSAAVGAVLTGGGNLEDVPLMVKM